MIKKIELEDIAENYPELVLADGFDGAILGVISIANSFHVLYDSDECVKILIKEHGMERDEAYEYLEFNVLCAYVGDNTPAFTV